MAKTGAAAAAAGRTAEELKIELRRLVQAITEGDDRRIESFKEAARVLEALKGLQNSRGNVGDTNTKRPSPLSPTKTPQKAGKIEPAEIPDQFICPISSEIMKDPVILATGETYDRPFIKQWLDSGKRTCPRTEQVLSNLTLTPNNVLRRLITNWCTDHNITLPPIVNPDESLVTRDDRNHLNAILNTISTTSSTIHDKKAAIKNLRQLTKQNSSHRAMLGENPHAILELLSLPSTPGLDDDPEVQEDTVSMILNLSIHESNKKTIGELPGTIGFLIDSLNRGTMQSRSNAAAALFTLADLGANKTKIGDMGAMGPLVGLLKQGSTASAKRDAASAIFNLCVSHENRGRAVKEGAIGVLLGCIVDGSLVDEALAVLAMLASDQEAVDEVGEGGGVACLLGVIRESSCGKNRENAAVVLFSVVMNDRTKMREVREEEGVNGTISKLAQNGTSRARRKAMGMLDRMRRTMHSTHNSC